MLLFGSLVRGTATPASDADLVIVLEKAEPRRIDRIPPLLRLFEESPLPLDIHPVTIEEWQAAGVRGDPLFRVAADHGLSLLP